MVREGKERVLLMFVYLFDALSSALSLSSSRAAAVLPDETLGKDVPKYSVDDCLTFGAPENDDDMTEIEPELVGAPGLRA